MNMRVRLISYPDGKKIQAIKALRDATCLGLKETKNLVESLPQDVAVHLKDIEPLRKCFQLEVINSIRQADMLASWNALSQSEQCVLILDLIMQGKLEVKYCSSPATTKVKPKAPWFVSNEDYVSTVEVPLPVQAPSHLCAECNHFISGFTGHKYCTHVDAYGPGGNADLPLCADDEFAKFFVAPSWCPKREQQ